jgi:hypothetical protein
MRSLLNPECQNNSCRCSCVLLLPTRYGRAILVYLFALCSFRKGCSRRPRLAIIDVRKNWCRVFIKRWHVAVHDSRLATIPYRHLSPFAHAHCGIGSGGVSSHGLRHGMMVSYNSFPFKRAHGKTRGRLQKISVCPSSTNAVIGGKASIMLAVV